MRAQCSWESVIPTVARYCDPKTVFHSAPQTRGKMKYSLQFTKNLTLNEVVEVKVVLKRGANTVFVLKYTLEAVFQNGPVFD